MKLPPTLYRVCYADTDQMGIVYYGNYAKMFEIARGEAFRELGMTYKSMEDGGIIMPVINLQVQYHAPAHYDDLLSILTSITEFPGTRVRFDHEIYNEAGKLIVSGSVALCFVDSNRRRPVKIPETMAQRLRTYWENQEL